MKKKSKLNTYTLQISINKTKIKIRYKKIKSRYKWNKRSSTSLRKDLKLQANQEQQDYRRHGWWASILLGHAEKGENRYKWDRQREKARGREQRETRKRIADKKDEDGGESVGGSR